MSDIHDRWDNFEKAIKITNDKGCEYLLFAGDFISPPGIKILKTFEGNTKFVWGNNEGEIMGFTRQLDALPNIELCGNIYDGKIDNLKIFMNHYPEPSILAAKTGDYDVSIYGHTHEYHHEEIGKTLLLNPGEIQGYKTGKITFMILNTVNMEVDKIHL